MSTEQKDKKEGNVVGQIAGGVLVALIAGGTSPWWWDKFFGGGGQPSQTSQASSPTISVSPSPSVSPSNSSPPVETSPTSQTSCQYKKTDPIRIEIRPERSVYSELDQIKVLFDIKGTPAGSRLWMTVVSASKAENAYEAYEYIGNSGSVLFKSKPTGDYKIRLFINTGSGDVPVVDCPIIVKSVTAQ
jgi:hypothetical protein